MKTTKQFPRLRTKPVRSSIPTMRSSAARVLPRLEPLEDRLAPAVFTVTTTADSGGGSLRQALLDSNAAAGPDTIAFNIPGTEVHTILPQSELPTATGPVTIDGYTQPGSRPNTAGPGAVSNGLQTIRLDGAQALGYGIDGLVLKGGQSTVRGLAITPFNGNEVEIWGDGNVAEGNTVGGVIYFVNGANNRAGGTAAAQRNDASIAVGGDFNTIVNNIGSIGISGSHNIIGGTTPQERNVINGFHTGLFISGSDNVAQGNFIGTDVSGMVRTSGANRRGGVFLDYTAQRNLIGGTTPGARNVICGSYAVTIDGASDNVFQGNYIGVNAAGTGTLFNPIGVRILSSNVETPKNNLFGGTAPGTANVISGNGTGIELISAVHTRIQGNLIGVLPDGHTPAGNTQEGVTIASTSYDNLIGGTEPGAGNVIANSLNLAAQSGGGTGVKILWYAGSPYHPVNGNAILGNSIFANAGLGIDIVELNGPPGVTPNDPGDADGGGNNQQNFPVLQSATLNTTGVTVSGTLNSTPGGMFRIEFFDNAAADPSGFGEGERFLGFATVTTDASGNASFTVTLPGVASGHFLTATATDAGNNTSEFSPALRAGSTAPAPKPPRPPKSPKIHSATAHQLLQAQAPTSSRTLDDTRLANLLSSATHRPAQRAVQPTLQPTSSASTGRNPSTRLLGTGLHSITNRLLQTLHWDNSLIEKMPWMHISDQR